MTKTRNGERKKEYNKINKVDKEGNITPGQLLKRLGESKYFGHIVNDSRLNKLTNKCITLIKEHCKQYNQIEAISNILDKEYLGLEGLTYLSENLTEFTKKARIFNFYHVSKKEFGEHDGKDLFLFKITNKDLSYCENFQAGKRKKRINQKENLHTLFFRALMHEKGFGDNVDIGKGEVFFREKVIEYDKETKSKGHHYELLKDKFNYPIISNKRYSEDKFLLHLSITLNYNSDSKDINNKISEAIQSTQDIQFIGIDRGEKHLVYSCIIDKDGKIIKGKCKDHDIINGTNYVEKLETVAGERISAKQNWQTQSKIRDLKSGYISHVVHNLVEEAIKSDGVIAPHAYIILEDLSTEMKRGRQKFEKQVYQNLEVALAKKLNFVVDKDAKQGELGSVSKALQLTPPISNYQDIEGKKQFGIMLYTRANYTSITDPATGWRKTIYIKNGKDEEIRTDILDRFSNFGFDGKDFFFEYIDANAGHTWRMYSGKDGKPLSRFQNKKRDKTSWGAEPVNVVEILEKLFSNFDKSKSFKEQIQEGVELTKHDDKTAWQSLRYALNMIQQIRNSGIEKKDDNFLCSPVRNENGDHFDTRNSENNGELSAIKDADANGAYNIARKGLIMDAHIKYWIENGRKTFKKDGKEIPDLDLFISDKEWDLWLLEKEQWRSELPIFATQSAKEGNTTTKVGKSRKKEKR